MLTIHVYQKSTFDINHMNKGITHYPEIGQMPQMQALFGILLSWRANEDLEIETASEYIIRQLQIEVAKGKLDPKKVEIWYHYNEEDLINGGVLVPEGELKDYKIEILQDGSLSRNFGTGFMDVAGNQDLMLYQLQKKRP